MKDSSLDSIMIAGEVDLSLASPEGIAHGQKLLGTSVPLIVLKEVSIGVLFLSGTASDGIQSEAAAYQQSEGVELLYESCRLHPA